MVVVGLLVGLGFWEWCRVELVVFGGVVGVGGGGAGGIVGGDAWFWSGFGAWLGLVGIGKGGSGVEGCLACVAC